MKQGRRARKFILRQWWTSVIWRMSNWRQSTKNTKVELYLDATLWKMIVDLMQYLQNMDHQHHKWRHQKSWISYPDCQGAQDKQLTQYRLKPMWKLKMLTNCLKFQNRNVQTFGFVYHDTTNHGPAWKIQSFLLSEICMVILWQDCYGKGNLRKSYWSMVGRRFPNWECLFVHREKGLFLSVYVDDIKLAGKKQNIDPMWKVLNQEVDFRRTNIFPWSCIHGMYSKTMWNKQGYCWQLQNHVWIENFRRSNGKITMLGKSEYFFMVLRYGRSCQEICGTILWVGKQDDSTTLQSIYSMHSWPSFQRRRIEIRGRIVKSMLSNCSEMLIIGTYWTSWYSMVSEQTCTIDHKMTKACDKRLCRLISYIHLTCEYKQHCHVGNTAKQCRLGLCQDSDFAGDLEDSKSTSGGTLCIFGSHTSVPISWMCKKQTSVSHSSTESEIISLDAGLRLDGIRALGLWDLIVAVLHGNTHQSNQARGDPFMNKREVRSTPHTIQKRKKSHGMINDLDNTSILLVRKLCCMCSKTTKQWSRWS